MEKEASEKCGVFGVYGSEDAAKLAWFGLHAMQHRGQESAGIVTYDGKKLYQDKGTGTTALAINASNLGRLKGYLALGHVRYSTSGESSLQKMENCQPLVKLYQKNPLAIAHNGNIEDTSILDKKLEDRLFRTTVDTELIMHLIGNSGEMDFRDKVVDALRQVPPSYALAMIYDDMLIAARDPYGYKPLSLGNLHGAHLIASESVAFDINDADFIRDIEPGEVLFIDKKGLEKRVIEKKDELRQCIFELDYFARPDSRVFGYSVSEVKMELGRQLVRECPTDADVVVPVPDAANAAALGYSEESRVPLRFGIVRNHYIGRTFIQPESDLRHFGAKMKFNADRAIVNGKKVIVIDDSIVRGTNAMKIAHMIKKAGAKEVHLRITFPPWKRHCKWGIDTKSDKELLAALYNTEEMRKRIGADSLHYLSLEGLLKSIPNSEKKFCTYCTGE